MTKAIIFDMDGTMINNMSYHLTAWEQMMHELNHPLRGKPLFSQLYGSNKGVIERIFGDGHFDTAAIQQLSDRKEEIYRNLYHPHIQLMPGLAAFLEQQYQRGTPMALGTASNRPNIDFTMETLGIRHYFKTIVSADDVAKGKPDPEVYLKAAAQMGIVPGECLVFEDVPKGVEAAANAGMKAIVVTSTHSPEEFLAYQNVITFIEDYNGFNIDNY